MLSVNLPELQIERKTFAFYLSALNLFYENLQMFYYKTLKKCFYSTIYIVMYVTRSIFNQTTQWCVTRCDVRIINIHMERINLILSRISWMVHPDFVKELLFRDNSLEMFLTQHT